jgi:hypothetical protein
MVGLANLNPQHRKSLMASGTAIPGGLSAPRQSLRHSSCEETIEKGVAKHGRAFAQAQTILSNIRNSDTGFHERVNGLEWAYKLDWQEIYLRISWLAYAVPCI